MKNGSLRPAITTSGANGLDTGSEAGSTWYHIWVIAKKDGTTAGLLSASATSPTIPSGYTFKAYIGAVYNGSSENFEYMYQTDNKVSVYIESVLSNGTSAAFASVSLATKIPTTAKSVFLDVNIGNMADRSVQVEICPESNGYSTTISYQAIATDTINYQRLQFNIFIKTAQTIYYRAYGGYSSPTNVSIAVVGYTY